MITNPDKLLHKDDQLKIEKISNTYKITKRNGKTWVHITLDQHDWKMLSTVMIQEDMS